MESITETFQIREIHPLEAKMDRIIELLEGQQAYMIEIYTMLNQRL